MKLEDCKVLIAVPCGTPYFPVEFMMSLLAMDKPVKYTIDIMVGVIIDHARNGFVESAIANDCTHILFLDSDMTFPKDIPTASSFLVLNTATVNSGSDVDNEIRINPTAVLPNPVISAILSLLIIVHLLKLPNKKSETSKINTFCTV